MFMTVLVYQMIGLFSYWMSNFDAHFAYMYIFIIMKAFEPMFIEKTLWRSDSTGILKDFISEES